MKPLLTLFAFMIFCGCTNTHRDKVDSSPSCAKDEEKMVYVKQKNANYKEPWSNEGLNIPNWINDPTINGKYYAAAGSCFTDGLSYTDYRAKAFESAIAEISRSMKVKVKSVYKSYETGDGVSYIEDVSKLESSEHVANAHIVSTWNHPIRREYYVWVVVE